MSVSIEIYNCHPRG